MQRAVARSPFRNELRTRDTDVIRHALLVLLATCLAHAAASSAAVRQVIVTASERGTYFRIGQDLARYVAPAADIDLVAATSAGSVENVRRLRSEQGVKFALVQSDVYQGYLDMAAAGNRAAAALVRPLRVILPLYNEEICFFVRADAPWSFVHEIRGARINAGETGSGTALTTATLYRLMFGQGLPDAGHDLPRRRAGAGAGSSPTARSTSSWSWAGSRRGAARPDGAGGTAACEAAAGGPGPWSHPRPR